MWDAIVVGAGICGLATAHALGERGARVLVVAEEVAGAQSAGLARIFRIAHREPRLCALALEARERWLAWEREFGLHLLGDEGLVVAHGEAYAAAMPTPVETLDRAAIRARLPLLNDHHPWDRAIYDPLAGSLRIRRAQAALAAHATIRQGRVERVDADGRVRVGGETLAADAVVVCAGVGTQALVAPLGLDLEMSVAPHVRVTYEPPRGVVSACMISPECYALPVGSTGLWALGMDERVDADWVARTFRGLSPVSELECVSLDAPWLDRGDGFVALRAGRVIALGASNAMKFGPLLGDRLARSALDGGLHSDLIQG